MSAHGDKQPGLSVSLPDAVSVSWPSLEDFSLVPVGEPPVRNKLRSLWLPQALAVKPQQRLIQSL